MRGDGDGMGMGFLLACMAWHWDGVFVLCFLCDAVLCSLAPLKESSSFVSSSLTFYFRSFVFEIEMRLSLQVDVRWLVGWLVAGVTKLHDGEREGPPGPALAPSILSLSITVSCARAGAALHFLSCMYMD